MYENPWCVTGISELTGLKSKPKCENERIELSGR